jgi:cyclomaltodextrinase
MAIQTPDWVKHAVFYQIFPDRFALSKNFDVASSYGITLEPWENPPTKKGYKGGNLWGVIEHLDYLVDLGINALYLTPIFASASNHRYHTHDYYQVDPLLGGNKAFDALIEAVHKNDIRIVLDGVFNHVGRGFLFFNDILENGKYSPWQSWFKVESWPLAPYDNEHPANYVCWENNRALPQFNHDHPAVREYIMQVGEYWIRKGIDGWRLDVADCIQAPGFWQEFRSRIREINPNAYIVGEVMSDVGHWLDGSQFDGVMNYRFRTHTIAFPAGHRLQSDYLKSWNDQPIGCMKAEDYAFKVQRLLDDYDWEIQCAQLNLLSSHDTPRLLTVVGGDRTSAYLSTLLLLTFPGAPCIYYGDEVGLFGGFDPENRGAFPRSQAQWDQEILAYHHDLIALRNKQSCLRTGKYQVLLASEDIFIFARFTLEEALIIGINISENCQEIYLPLESFLAHFPLFQPRNLYGLGKAIWTNEINNKSLQISFLPRSGIILG